MAVCSPALQLTQNLVAPVASLNGKTGFDRLRIQPVLPPHNYCSLLHNCVNYPAANQRVLNWPSVNVGNGSPSPKPCSARVSTLTLLWSIVLKAARVQRH